MWSEAHGPERKGTALNGGSPGTEVGLLAPTRLHTQGGFTAGTADEDRDVARTLHSVSLHRRCLGVRHCHGRRLVGVGGREVCLWWRRRVPTGPKALWSEGDGKTTTRRRQSTLGRQAGM